MNTSAEFTIRGDPTEGLFNDEARADSVLMIRQAHGQVTVFDGHHTAVRPHARVLLDRAVQFIAVRDSMLSPLIHGLESGGTGCDPVALLIRPRGEAIIMPVESAEAQVRLQNPYPVIRHHA